MLRLPVLLSYLVGVFCVTIIMHNSVDEPNLPRRGIAAAPIGQRSIEARGEIENLAQPTTSLAELITTPERQENNAIVEHETVKPASNAWCPQWWTTAVAMGWPSDALLSMDAVIHRESRCKPSAFNRKDPNGGSRGLMQINGSWRRWLRERGVIKTEEDLYHPDTNLKAALLIYQYGLNRYDFGWGPWGFRYVDPYAVYIGGK